MNALNSEIAPDDRIVARKDLFSSAVGDELVIFDSENGVYFGSGLVGQKIWNSLSEEKSPNAVCDELMNEFDVDRATCEKQVLSFIQELRSRGLITVATKPE